MEPPITRDPYWRKKGFAHSFHLTGLKESEFLRKVLWAQQLFAKNRVKRRPPAVEEEVKVDTTAQDAAEEEFLKELIREKRAVRYVGVYSFSCKVFSIQRSWSGDDLARIMRMPDMFSRISREEQESQMLSRIMRMPQGEALSRIMRIPQGEMLSRIMRASYGDRGEMLSRIMRYQSQDERLSRIMRDARGEDDKEDLNRLLRGVDPKLLDIWVEELRKEDGKSEGQKMFNDQLWSQQWYMVRK